MSRQSNGADAQQDQGSTDPSPRARPQRHTTRSREIAVQTMDPNEAPVERVVTGRDNNVEIPVDPRRIEQNIIDRARDIYHAAAASYERMLHRSDDVQVLRTEARRQERIRHVLNMSIALEGRHRREAAIAAGRAGPVRNGRVNPRNRQPQD